MPRDLKQDQNLIVQSCAQAASALRSQRFNYRGHQECRALHCLTWCPPCKPLEDLELQGWKPGLCSARRTCLFCLLCQVAFFIRLRSLGGRAAVPLCVRVCVCRVRLHHGEPARHGGVAVSCTAHRQQLPALTDPTFSIRATSG